MASVGRVTVTLPNDLVQDIDRREQNRAELRRSMAHPHTESANLTEDGLEEWSRGLPEEDMEALVDAGAGTPVRWVPGEGWAEADPQTRRIQR